MLSQEAAAESSFIPSVLSHAQTLASVSTLRQVFESSLGLGGQCKLVHNSVGGHVTVTSSATQLLRTVPLSCPVLRLITSAIERHCAVYKDGGMIAGTLALLIVECALKLSVSELHLVVDTLDKIVEHCLLYFREDKCPACVELNFESLTELLRIVKGVLSTKPVCGLYAGDVDHLCCCITRITLAMLVTDNSAVTAKIGCVTSHSASSHDILSCSTTSEHCQPIGASNSQLTDTQQLTSLDISSLPYTTVVLLGCAVSDSCVVEGTLIETKCAGAVYNNKSMLPMHPHGSQLSFVKQHQLQQTLIAIFSTSLAGDCTQSIIDVDTIELSASLNMDDVIMTSLMSTAVSLVELGVQVVVCQKVIHPKVKRYLHSRGLWVYDRLGVDLTLRLQQQTSAQLIASFQTQTLSQQQFGHIRQLSHVCILDKTFVCIEGDRPAFSLVLCAPLQQAADELEILCQSANHVLKQAISQPQALVGCGQWQRHLAEYLCQSTVGDMAVAGRCVAHCLDRLADIISVPGSSCVLDVQAASLSGLQTAILAAQLVLRIGCYVTDIN